MCTHTHTHNQQLYSKWNSAFAHAWVAECLPGQVYDLGEDPPGKAGSALREFFVRGCGCESTRWPGAARASPEQNWGVLSQPTHFSEAAPGRGLLPSGTQLIGNTWALPGRPGPRGLPQLVGWLVYYRQTHKHRLAHTHMHTQAHKHTQSCTHHTS